MSDNVLSAFEILLTEIQTVREQIADALKQASPTDTKRLAHHIGQIVEVASEVEALRQRWAQLDEPESTIEEETSDDSETDSPPDDDEIDEGMAKGMFGKGEPVKKPPRPPRIKRGSCTPEKAYRIPILEVLCELGDSGEAEVVVERVKEKMKERLCKADFELLDCGEERWHKLAHFARFKMAKEGLLAKGSRGIWQITPAGRTYLDEHRRAQKGGQTNDSGS